MHTYEVTFGLYAPTGLNLGPNRFPNNPERTPVAVRIDVLGTSMEDATHRAGAVMVDLGFTSEIPLRGFALVSVARRT